MKQIHKHQTTINTTCNILRTVIAGASLMVSAAALMVAIASLKVKSQQQSQPEVAVPTETQY